MDATYLRGKHEAGMTYEQYVRSGTPQQLEHWKTVHDLAKLTDEQTRLVGSFVRRINVIGLSGIWCGDCVQQCPLVQKIAEANPKAIDLRWLDRDIHDDLQQRVKICGGNRVPVFLFMAEDYELVGWYGDRTLSRYRAVAARQLGPSCPLPGAPVHHGEMADTLGEWLNELERVHLLLRLSSRLRQKHGD